MIKAPQETIPEGLTRKLETRTSPSAKLIIFSFPAMVAGKKAEQIGNLLGDFADQVVDPVGKQAARVYKRLQERLKAANALEASPLTISWFRLSMRPARVTPPSRA